MRVVGTPVPILRIFDENEARDFYLRYLGFEVLFEHRFAEGLPLYLAVKLGACELHLSEHHGDATPGSAVRIELDDVDAYLSALNARGHPRLSPSAQDQPWDAREVGILDPFGNRLIFWQSLA